MFFEMTCACSASLQVDVDEPREDLALILVTRFTNAHVSCGFVSPAPEETQDQTKRHNLRISPEQDS